MVSKFFKKCNWGSNIGRLQRLCNYKESEYNICVKVQILTNGKQYHLPVMGLIICIHYKTPSVWPGILRIMSFNRADSNSTWKGGGWRNTDRHYNLGNKTFCLWALIQEKAFRTPAVQCSSSRAKKVYSSVSNWRERE